MNVRQLIEKLLKVDDKDAEVLIDPPAPDAQLVDDVQMEDGLVFLVTVR